MSFELSNSLVSAGGAQLNARLEAARGQRVQAMVENAAKELQNAAAKAEQGAAASPARAQKMAQLEKVAKDFESVMLAYMLKTMRETVPQSDFLGGSREREIYTAMHDEELAKKLSQAGGIGLSKLLVAQLKNGL